MSTWIPLTAIDQLADGSYERFEFYQVDVLVFREGQNVYAIEDRCTHDDSGLCGGYYVNGTIACPRHGAQFCIRTGQALSPPAYEATTVYPLRVVENGLIEIAFDA